ncbi:MAG TPA: DUF502 domain-containing protein [Syntrophales bacterium]|nr:DUF502 domain-containing protein [Syntrophales bacterium]
MKKKIQQIFLTGLAVVVPVVVTIYVLVFLVRLMDGLLSVVPQRFHPDTLLGVHIPGLGIIFTAILVFLSGLITRSYVGHRLVRTGDRILQKIPFVRGVYRASKQVSDSLIREKGNGFRKVVLVEFPRPGTYAIGFVTGQAAGEIRERIGEAVSVFLPTAPNPTSGYILLVQERDLVPLEMTVEQAFTLIVSGGMVAPPDRGSPPGADR